MVIFNKISYLGINFFNAIYHLNSRNQKIHGIKAFLQDCNVYKLCNYKIFFN